MRDWPPCPPIQRDGGRRSRPGVNPFISALTVARCPATFSGVWPQLRDTLSTSRSVGRGTGAFIYAQSAVETRPVLTALRHASTALFSCRSKCPCPPRRQRHFHGNADRAYNTLKGYGLFVDFILHLPSSFRGSLIVLGWYAAAVAAHKL